MSRIDRLRVLYGNNVKEYKGYIEIKDNNNRLFLSENGRKITINDFWYYNTFGDVILFNNLEKSLVIHNKNGKNKVVHDIAIADTFDRQYFALAYQDKIGIYNEKLDTVLEIDTVNKIKIEFVKNINNRIEVILSYDNKKYSHVLIYDFTINTGNIVEYNKK